MKLREKIRAWNDFIGIDALLVPVRWMTIPFAVAALLFAVWGAWPVAAIAGSEAVFGAVRWRSLSRQFRRTRDRP